MGTSASKKKGDSDNTLPVCNDESTAEEISTWTAIGVKGVGDDEGSSNVLVDAHVENEPINNSVGESDTDEEYYSASDGEGNSKITNQITLSEIDHDLDFDPNISRSKINLRRSGRVKKKQPDGTETPRGDNRNKQVPRPSTSAGNRNRVTKRMRSTNSDEDHDSENAGRKNSRTPKRRCASTSISKPVSERQTSTWNLSFGENQDEDILFKERLIGRLTKRKQGETTMKRFKDDPRRELDYNQASGIFSVGGIQVIFEGKGLICVVCDGKFEGNSKNPRWNMKMYNLEKEITTHVVKKHLGGFKCTVCGQGLCSYFNWKQHMELHSEIKCDICGKQVSSKKSLKRHKLSHMNAEEKTQMGMTVTAITPMKDLTCLQCSKTFGSEQHLNQHYKLVHGDRERVQCPKCGKLMLEESYRRYHSTVVCPEQDVKRIQCTLCIDTFKSDRSLQGHMKNVHAPHRKNELKDGKYCCEWCIRMFEDRKALTQHKIACNRERIAEI